MSEEDEPIPAPAPATVRKCSRIQWCAGMSMALHGVPKYSEGKGLAVRYGWVGDDERPHGIVYRKKAKEDGLVVNFCPWCGASVRFESQRLP